MRVLYLSQRVPYPPNRGDRITTFHQVRHLAKRHEVICHAFTDEPGDSASIEALEKLGARVVVDHVRPIFSRVFSLPYVLTDKPLTLPYFRSRRLSQATRRELARGVDLVIAYSSSMAQLALEARAPRVMEFGDLDSEKWAQYAAASRGPARWVYAREARRLLEWETRIAREFDASLITTAAEAADFERRTGVRPFVVGNGVDLARFHAGPDSARVPGRIVFTGVMDYRPNVEGCTRFATRILPLVREALPEAHFQIVGARPSREALALAGDGVDVTGAVPDTATFLREARVAVAPLSLGRGLQNKVLEAMACGTPVVATSNASAGVDATPGEHYLRADEDAEFARHVIRCLSDAGAAAALGERGRARVVERYGWDRALDEFDRSVEAAIENYRRRSAVTERPSRTPAAPRR